MATLPDGTSVPTTVGIRERVDEVIIRRPKAGDPVDAPNVIKVVTVIRDGVDAEQKSTRLDDSERVALWTSVATLTFKNWIMNQIIPQADTPV